LLDLSSAFDTVDHRLLLAILQKRFAVTDSALAWFQSYLADRTQTVHLQAQVSSTIHSGVARNSQWGGSESRRRRRRGFDAQGVDSETPKASTARRRRRRGGREWGGGFPLPSRL